MRTSDRIAGTALLCALAAPAGGALAAAPDAAAPEGAPQRVDYLTFAEGAVPVRVGGAGAKQGATFEHAVEIADGNPTGFSIVNRATAETDTEFVYALPAPTTFDRFAVPNVLETPSPAQTFMRVVEVYGSASGPDEGFTLLASGTLTTHRAPGEVSELAIAATVPVRWVKVRLVGGIEMHDVPMFLEFSEIIGNGHQKAPPLANVFTGAWRGRGVELETRQEGAVVSGCYDKEGELNGTVTGNILRATGVSRRDQVPSAFVLGVADDGSLRGVRSTNGAPFRLYTAPAAPKGKGAGCGTPPAPALGCGSIIHGIRFAFDSAEIQPDSAPLLAALFAGLQSGASATIVIEGHTSSEGADAYNQDLSERRARAVVDDLVRRGLAADRVRAEGAGETRPIASNADESGRSLNRRVEVRCL